MLLCFRIVQVLHLKSNTFPPKKMCSIEWNNRYKKLHISATDPPTHWIIAAIFIYHIRLYYIKLGIFWVCINFLCFLLLDGRFLKIMNANFRISFMTSLRYWLSYVHNVSNLVKCLGNSLPFKIALQLGSCSLITLHKKPAF